MAPVKKPPRQLMRHFFKEWREFRQLTQERAAERLDIDRTTLGRVENRRIPYGQYLLEAAAKLYGCEPSDIIDVDPLNASEVAELVQMLKAASPEVRAEIIGYARGRLVQDPIDMGT